MYGPFPSSSGANHSLTHLQQGVTATNPNVNIISWFADNILGDLQSGAGVHPVLQVDAIRFLYTFRYQVLFEDLNMQLTLC